MCVLVAFRMQLLFTEFKAFEISVATTMDWGSNSNVVFMVSTSFSRPHDLAFPN